MTPPACFFKGWSGAGACDGRLIAAHLIPKQLLRREVCSARSKGSSGRWPVTTDQRAELARILWDPRVVVPCCGGPTGIGGHHGKLDTAAIRPLRIPWEKLPAGLEEYVAELGLPRVRAYLDRTYGGAGKMRPVSKHAHVIRNTTIAPYVGTGADGCRRSAQIVRDELATLDAGDPRRDELEAQAQAWEDRAAAA